MTASRHARRPRPLAARDETRADHVQRVLRVLVHVRSRLSADLSLERLATLAHFSPAHFQRVFERVVGESPKRHVHRLRLERAARALRSGDTPIVDVAGDAGYVDVPTFYRAFRAHFGTSPAEWRDRAQMRWPRSPMPAAVQRWHTALGRDAQLQSVPYAAADAPADAAPAVRLVQLPPLRVAFVMRRGAVRASDAANDFARLLAFASRRTPVGDPFFLCIHHDQPAITPAHLRRTDHAIVVGPRRRGDGDIGVATLGRTHALVATCAGQRHVEATRRWLEQAAAGLGAPCSGGPVLELRLDPPAELAPSSPRTLHDVLVPVSPIDTLHPWYLRRRRPPAAQHRSPRSR